MKKIVLLPLDERPCNVKYPMTLFNGGNMQIVCPDKLGDKKQPADYDYLAGFLKKECANAYGLVVSIEMLLYGGLVPSRMHYESIEALKKRLEFLRFLRREYPLLKIFAFNCIMRCPQYSSNAEEPDYYADFGAEIHALGVACHRLLKNDNDEKLQIEKARLKTAIPAENLKDFTSRRAINLEINLCTLSLLQDDILDFLIIPQDDAAPLGYTAMDQAIVRQAVREKCLQGRALIYPGADELALTLLTRMRNELENKAPKIYVKYASAGAPFVIPRYEDRPLDETLAYHIMASGCRRVQGEEQAELILAVTAPPNEILEASLQPHTGLDYDVKRSLPPFIQAVCEAIEAGKSVAICDNAYCNGGDLEVLAMMNTLNILMRVAAYAGWNSSANTIGTAIAQGVRYIYEGKDDAHMAFLALRYVEDCAYDSCVRQEVMNEDLQRLGLNYRDVQDCEGTAAACVKERLEAFVKKNMSSISSHIKIGRVQMPWKRMFEASIEVQYEE